MTAIATCCYVRVGYGARGVDATAKLLVALPVVFSISLFLIADVDSRMVDSGEHWSRWNAWTQGR